MIGPRFGCVPLLSLLVIIPVLLTRTSVADDNAERYEQDDGVYVLTESNFDDFIMRNPTALIEFYAPWCGHCKSLAPEYAKAAKRLTSKDPSVPLAKVDATVEESLGKKFDVKGFPTLKFWKDGNPEDYDGPRDSDGIVDWVSQRADPHYKPPPEAVFTLTASNFDDFVAKHELVLVEFYAPWCGHCKQLTPQFEKAAKRLKELPKPIMLGKVDATVEKSLGDKFGVSGYPTLKILRNGKRFDYNGPREADGIIRYMIDQAQPAAKKLETVKEANKFMSKDDVTLIGFFPSEDSKLLENYGDAAEAAREEFKLVGYSLDPETMKQFKAKPNDIVLYYPEKFWSDLEPRFQVLRKPTASQEDILAFWRDNAAPLVGHRTKENVRSQYSKLPLVVVYFTVDFTLAHRDGTQYWRKKVLNIAKQYKEKKYRFAISDEEEFAQELAEVGLGDSGLEQNVIVFGIDGKKYPMDPDKFDEDFEENIEAFMEKVNQGRIKPYVKSAPAPKDDKSPLKTVVGSTFAKIVLDESKDVLVEFYAPWCGHCKSFEPKYKQLAAKLATDEPNLVLTKYDATANDAPENYNVEGFPTIYFAPAGKKDEPIKYDGNRDLDHLTEFMKKHAVRSFKSAKKTEL